MGSDTIRICIPHFDKLEKYDFHLLISAINEINRKSLFLKSYLADDSILVLEYRFKAVDDISITLEGIINNVFSLENILDKL